jgi:hypothetical protein
MRHNPNSKSQRFLGAASTLLKAMKSSTGMNSQIPIRGNAASSMRFFTLKELVDAMSMLVRLGIVPALRSTDAAIRDGWRCGNQIKPTRPKRGDSSNKSFPDRPFVDVQFLTRTVAMK